MPFLNEQSVPEATANKGKKRTELLKQYLTTVLVCLLMGALVAVLACITYYGKLRDTKAASIKESAEYVLVNLDNNPNSPEEIDALLKNFDLLDDELALSSGFIEQMFAIDLTNEKLHGKIDPKIIKLIDPTDKIVRLTGGKLFTPYPLGDRYVLWFVNSVDDITSIFRDYVKNYIRFFLVALAVLAVLLMPFFFLMGRWPKLSVAVYITVLLWTLVLYAWFLSGMMEADVNRHNVFLEARLVLIDEDVKQLSELTDAEVQDVFNSYTEEKQEYLRQKVGNDLRLGILYSLIEYDNQFSHLGIKFTPKQNIWNDYLPIRDRIEVNTNFSIYLQTILDFLLQAVMIAVFSMLTIKQILSSSRRSMLSNVIKPDGIDEERFARIQHDTVLMKGALTLNIIAGALTAIVSTPLLKAWIEYDFGTFRQDIFNVIVIVSAAIECATIFILPRFIKKCKKVTRYLRLSIAICVPAALLCFMAKKGYVFILGYLLLAFGNGFTKMIKIIYTMSNDEELEGMYVLVSLKSAVSVGSLTGSVISAVLQPVLKGEQIFLIAAVLYVIIIIISFAIRGEFLTHPIPERTYFRELIQRKEILLYFITIMIPFGFQSYFFRYKVSLDAEALGLTTVVVSFVHFMRSVMGMVIGKIQINKALWKKMSDETKVPLMILLIAIVFLLYLPFHNVWVLLLAAITMAYIRASLNTVIYRYSYYVLMEGDYDNSLGNSALIITGKGIGRSIAPLISNVFGGFLLPGIMLMASLTYIIRRKIAKKKS